MWPFKRKPIVDAETAAWHADNFGWLIRQFDGSGALRSFDDDDPGIMSIRQALASAGNSSVGAGAPNPDR